MVRKAQAKGGAVKPVARIGNEVRCRGGLQQVLYVEVERLFAKTGKCLPICHASARHVQLVSLLYCDHHLQLIGAVSNPVACRRRKSRGSALPRARWSRPPASRRRWPCCRAAARQRRCGTRWGICHCLVGNAGYHPWPLSRPPLLHAIACYCPYCRCFMYWQ